MFMPANNAKSLGRSRNGCRRRELEAYAGNYSGPRGVLIVFCVERGYWLLAGFRPFKLFPLIPACPIVLPVIVLTINRVKIVTM